MPAKPARAVGTVASTDVSIWPWAGDLPKIYLNIASLRVVLTANERSRSFTLCENLRMHGKDARSGLKQQQPKWAFALTNGATEIWVSKNAGDYSVSVTGHDGHDVHVIVDAAVGAKLHATLTREIAKFAKRADSGLVQRVTATSVLKSEYRGTRFQAKKTVFGFP